MEIPSVNESIEFSSLFGIKNDSFDKISSPSDLFGKEILPEYTIESEYGTLKFNPIIVPDFSNNNEEFENFKICFNEIKKLYLRKICLKKETRPFI